MRDPLPEFTDIIGDVEAFRFMLEGAAKAWRGSYNVLLADTYSYLYTFQTAEQSQPFFSQLRSTPRGRDFYVECDLNAVRLAKQESKPIVYTCRIGIAIVAVPIFIGEELIATILCGQIRASNTNQCEHYVEHIRRLAKELQFNPVEFIRCWKQVPEVTTKEIDHIEMRMERVAEQVSRGGRDKLDLIEARRAAQQTQEMTHAWMQQIAHQLVGPLHGLQGYAEMALKRLQRWRAEDTQYLDSRTEEDIAYFTRYVEALVWTSRYAARLAHNLAWTASSEQVSGIDLDLEVITDVPGLLVAIARDFQGLAAARRLRRLAIDTESASVLNSRISVNEDLFRQAIGNILDNAVKYANSCTDILVQCGVVDAFAVIEVTNWGIQLIPEETELIFEYYSRGQEARMRYPTGTGIGLAVARQIIQLHGGTLKAKPSKQTTQGWRTVFTIQLPLHESS